jgi:hypothetical protein
MLIRCNWICGRKISNIRNPQGSQVDCSPRSDGRDETGLSDHNFSEMEIIGVENPRLWVGSWGIMPRKNYSIEQNIRRSPIYHLKHRREFNMEVFDVLFLGRSSNFVDALNFFRSKTAEP